MSAHSNQVEAFAAEKKLSLPADMLEVAKKYGLRSSVLNAFLAAQVGGWVVHSRNQKRNDQPVGAGRLVRAKDLADTQSQSLHPSCRPTR